MTSASIPQTYVGIDYHKRYSVASAVDADGQRLAEGRIEGNRPEGFRQYFAQLPGEIHVVFEACWNWCALYETLEEMCLASIQLSNPYRTRLIAESQIKTDKLDARKLAELRRGNFIAQVHIPSASSRQRKEVMRQRAFWVKQRTQLRNRIHKLLDRQRDLTLPQVSDLFGKKGMAALKKIQLATADDQMLLQQNLIMLDALNVQVREIELGLKQAAQDEASLSLLQSIPGIGLTMAPIIAAEIDDIERFQRSDKLCCYAGLVPSTHSSGGKTFHGAMLRASNKWLKWAFIEAAWVAVGCNDYFGGIYQRHRSRGKAANKAICIVARRLCKIAWHVLHEARPYQARPAPIKLSPGTL